MTRTILITRPRDDGDDLAEALHERGFRVIHEPLMEIFLRHTERHALEQALLEEPAAVIVTSKNGVRALAALTELRDASLICVGEATADAALSAGFLRTADAGGNVQKLVEFIAAAYDEESRFLYVSGEQVRIDIGAALKTRGMQTERLALYEAIAAEQLPDTLIELLKRGQIDAVTFFSPRTAEIFAELLERNRLQSAASRMDAFALSEAVAEALAALPWKAVHTAREATLASVVECVDNTAG